jgi:hypothetical protein
MRGALAASQASSGRAATGLSSVSRGCRAWWAHRREVGGAGVLAADDVPVHGCAVVAAVEGRHASRQLVGQHTQGPPAGHPCRGRCPGRAFDVSWGLLPAARKLQSSCQPRRPRRLGAGGAVLTSPPTASGHHSAGFRGPCTPGCLQAGVRGEGAGWAQGPCMCTALCTPHALPRPCAGPSLCSC